MSEAGCACACACACAWQPNQQGLAYGFACLPSSSRLHEGKALREMLLKGWD
jgi:hypothetical protein